MHFTGNQEKRVVPMMNTFFLIEVGRTSHRKDAAEKKAEYNLLFLPGSSCFLPASAPWKHWGISTCISGWITWACAASLCGNLNVTWGRNRQRCHTATRQLSWRLHLSWRHKSNSWLSKQEFLDGVVALQWESLTVPRWTLLESVEVTS